MKSDEILGNKLRKLRKLMGYSQERLSEKLTDYLVNQGPNKRYDDLEKTNLGFSTDSVGRFERGEIPASKKNFIAKVYSDYCKNLIDSKEQITKEIILNNVKTDKWIEIIWPGYPQEKDFPGFESAKSLLVIPDKEDVEVPDSEFFRVTGPEYTDFKYECVYIESDQIKNISNKLEKYRIVLLKSDKPATGKTVLCRALAYERYGDGLQTHFFQVSTDYGKSTLLTIVEKIIAFGDINPDNLLVIEDAHLNPVFVNGLLKKKHLFLSKILITSREIYGIPRGEKNLFKSLKTIIIEPSKDLIDEIITLYINTKDLTFPDERLEKLKANINDIYNRKLLKGSVNLWLLSYALRVIKSNDNKHNIQISIQDIINEVEGYLEGIENGKTIRVNLILALSVLYRFEIKTDIQWLYERFRSQITRNKIRDILEKLYTEGEVTRSKNKKLYGLPHSALAELYFKFTKEENGSWQDDKLYGDEEDFIYSYLVSKESKNWFELFEYKLLDKIKELPQKLISNLDINKLAKKIDKLQKLSDISNIIKYIYRDSTNARNELWEEINKGKLAKKINSSVFLFEIGSFINQTFQYSNDDSNELWQKIDKGKLAKIIDDSMNLQDIVFCITNIYKGSNDAGDELWKEMSASKLAKKFDDSDNLMMIDFYILKIYRISKGAGIELCKKIDINKMAKKINESDDLVAISVNIGAVFASSEAKRKEVWSKVNDDKIVQTIDKFKNLFIIEFFVFMLTYDNDILKELFKKIKMDRLVKLIDKSNNLPNMHLCLENVWNNIKNNDNELCDKSKINNIVKRDYSEDFHDKEPCMKDFPKSSENDSEKSGKRINVKNIAEQINNSSNLNSIILCIENVLQNSENTWGEICIKLDMEKLAQTVNESICLDRIVICIKLIFKGYSVAGKELCEKINVEMLSKKTDKYADAFYEFIIIILYIDFIFQYLEGGGKELLYRAGID